MILVLISSVKFLVATRNIPEKPAYKYLAVSITILLLLILYLRVSKSAVISQEIGLSTEQKAMKKFLIYLEKKQIMISSSETIAQILEKLSDYGATEKTINETVALYYKYRFSNQIEQKASEQLRLQILKLKKELSC